MKVMFDAARTGPGEVSCVSTKCFCRNMIGRLRAPAGLPAPSAPGFARPKVLVEFNQRVRRMVCIVRSSPFNDKRADTFVPVERHRHISTGPRTKFGL